MVQLEAQLAEATRNGESLRSRLAEALAESRDKEEEIRKWVIITNWVFGEGVEE